MVQGDFDDIVQVFISMNKVREEIEQMMDRDESLSPLEELRFSESIVCYVVFFQLTARSAMHLEWRNQMTLEIGDEEFLAFARTYERVMQSFSSSREMSTKILPIVKSLLALF